MRILVSLLLIATSQAVLSETPYYNVELLFFTQQSGSAEQFPAYPGTPDTVLNAPPLGSKKGFRVLRGGRLAGVQKRLASRPGYSPIKLLAWRQPLPNHMAPKPAKIDLQSPDGKRIVGTVALGRSKYGILRVDVLLQENGASYRLKDEIRMQRNDLYYIDHPKMGIIATITKLK